MAETEATLSKVDSANQQPEVKAKRRPSSMAADCYDILDLQKEGKTISIAPETQKLGWKLNKSPSTVDDPAFLALPLCTPKVKKITLHFPLGLEVSARNMKGVTIKDALDAIHKQFKKRQDDEFEKPYLAGFEWDPEEDYTRFIVHQTTTATSSFGKDQSSKKKKKKAAEEGLEE
ncbi:uncharacterized protein M421DRAFT_421183 [Didymella exigua CBS 183.55]|uniref:DUF6699 domain-containing protein n=1 Tax=Didymella exigua CBS 183.55 TaxID=1150837 RepID=A0A6A5RL53_9PLEO|nr:uncharacterized protein M421DRAFT_421183 [Didymella exigua CBS 183.55]KAF1927980.1 hypothetical protein M421DRAFT_421183 [Didymella exigua CBS 183.55]